MKVAIITEGFQGTGYGHLTRCLSIYQAFEEKDIIPYYFANCDEIGKKYLQNVNLIQLDWVRNIEVLLNKVRRFDAVIIDSYLAPLTVYEQIAENVKKCIYIDDYMRINYPPGVVINGTIGAEKFPYGNLHSKKYKYLLGLNYMPLRKEFWDVSVNENKNVDVRNILITFGGQDIRGLTNIVLNYLYSKFDEIIFHVVLPTNIKEQIFSENIKYYRQLNASEMLNLMQSCELAISAAGQTSYELARVGLKSILVGVIDNQKYNLQGWKKKGFINKIFLYNDKNLLCKIEREINQNLRTKRKVFYNGQGARKIVENIRY